MHTCEVGRRELQAGGQRGWCLLAFPQPARVWSLSLQVQCRAGGCTITSVLARPRSNRLRWPGQRGRRQRDVDSLGTKLTSTSAQPGGGTAHCVHMTSAMSCVSFLLERRRAFHGVSCSVGERAPAAVGACTVRRTAAASPPAPPRQHRRSGPQRRPKAPEAAETHLR